MVAIVPRELELGKPINTLILKPPIPICNPSALISRPSVVASAIVLPLASSFLLLPERPRIYTSSSCQHGLAHVDNRDLALPFSVLQQEAAVHVEGKGPRVGGKSLVFEHLFQMVALNDSFWFWVSPNTHLTKKSLCRAWPMLP